PALHTLSLHDALPISRRGERGLVARADRWLPGAPSAERAGVTSDVAATRGARRTVLQDGRAKAYRPMPAAARRRAFAAGLAAYRDRKSTRLNSSHVAI